MNTYQVNLSCNFFKGSFDIPSYIEFVDKYWKHLEQLEANVDIVHNVANNSQNIAPQTSDTKSAPKKRKGK